MQSFRNWVSVVRRHKFTSASRLLLEHHPLLGRNRHTRRALLRLGDQLARVSAMGVADIPANSTRHVNDFAEHQQRQLAAFRNNWSEFRSAVLTPTVLDAAKSTFADAGFSYDDYAAELAAHSSAIGVASTLSGLSDPNQQLRPPKKLTFIEQANKRQCCLFIISFVRLVDCMVRQTLHQLCCNSIIAIERPLTLRWRREAAEAAAATLGADNEGGGGGSSSSGEAVTPHKSSFTLTATVDPQSRKGSQVRRIIVLPYAYPHAQ